MLDHATGLGMSMVTAAPAARQIDGTERTERVERAEHLDVRCGARAGVETSDGRGSFAVAGGDPDLQQQHLSPRLPDARHHVAGDVSHSRHARWHDSALWSASAGFRS